MELLGKLLIAENLRDALWTLELLAPLEQRGHVPVVSSTPHALWAGVRLLGLSGRAPGFGTLLSKA